MVFSFDLTAQNNQSTDNFLIDEEEDETMIGNIERINAKNENVFFVETQNLTEHKLSERQACSIESAGMYKITRSFLKLLSKFFI